MVAGEEDQKDQKVPAKEGDGALKLVYIFGILSILYFFLLVLTYVCCSTEERPSTKGVLGRSFYKELTMFNKAKTIAITTAIMSLVAAPVFAGGIKHPRLNVTSLQASGWYDGFTNTNNVGLAKGDLTKAESESYKQLEGNASADILITGPNGASQGQVVSFSDAASGTRGKAAAASFGIRAPARVMTQENGTNSGYVNAGGIIEPSTGGYGPPR